jgi:hypothetical protein
VRSLRFLLLLLTFPLAAQQADLAVDVTSLPVAGVGGPLFIRTVIRNLGPDSADAVRLVVALPPGTRYFTPNNDPRCAETFPGQIRCNLGLIPANTEDLVVLNFVAGEHAGEATFTTELLSTTPDPVRANNIDTAVVTLDEAADLRIFQLFAVPSRVNPGEPVLWSVGVANEGFAPAHDVVLMVRLPQGSEFRSVNAPGWDCTGAGTAVTCTRPRLEGSIGSVDIIATAPASELGGAGFAEAEIASSTPDPDPSNNRNEGSVRIFRIFRVTTTDDEGGGSLRQTILDANRDCNAHDQHCRILFDLAATLPESGRHVITPRSPLPPLFFGVFIEGDGKVELNGELAGANADGLVILGCASGVRGMVIREFQGNGVFLLPPRPDCAEPRTIIDNEISANGLRGITAVGLTFGQVHVRNNLLTGNRHSGIWQDATAFFEITGNRIVLNGASGIYFGPSAGSSDVSNNIIAANAHWGVVLDNRASRASIRRNSIHSNSILGIDYGHNLVTPNDPGDGIPDHPLLTSARYDAATNTTRIEGVISDRVPESPQLGFIVDFFVNGTPDGSGHGEGETPLGDVRVAVGGPFSFLHPGDLRGRFITATSTRFEAIGFKSSGFFEQTSEFSNSIAVTE